MSVTSVKVMLSGGPPELATAERSIPVADLRQTLKIRHGAGYEHFVQDGKFLTVDGSEVVVFRWTYRTKIAE